MTSTEFEVLTNDTRSVLDGWSVVEAGTSQSQGQGLSAEVALERDAVGLAAGEMKAVLSVVAPRMDDKARAPLHLVAVLDKSGSMSGEKIRLVKATMIHMLRYLSDRDSLGIVEYGSDVKVTAPLTVCDQEGRSRLQQALQRIQISGQTNLSGGLLKGLELHRDKPRAAAAAAAAEQAVQIGNTYRRLTQEEAQARGEGHFGYPGTAVPEGAERVHEWTMALRLCGLESLVQKVVFRLHDTFRDPVVEVAAPPFQLTRFGWGTFEVGATLHLHDGRQLTASHMLSFDRPETFRTILLPLKTPSSSFSGAGAAGANFWGLCGASSADASSELLEDDGVVRSTFLFTDGQANFGINDTAGICTAAANMLAELRNCKSSISTFGFGADHDVEMLSRLAESGEGSYSHVQSEDQIAEAFGEALGGLLSTSHQNVSLSLQLAPGVGFLRAFTAFPVEPVNGDRVKVEVGDLFAEERRDILVSLSLPPAGAEGLQGVGRLEVRGFSVTTKRSESDAKALAVERSEGAQADAVSASRNEQVERHWNRHLANEALEKARATAERDLPAARQLLDAASVALGASPLVAAGDPVSLGLLTDLRDCMDDLRHRDDYMEKGSKKLAMMTHAHSKQRAANGASMNADWSTSMQKDFGAAFKMSIA